MNTNNINNNLVFVWPHYAAGKMIGEIRRFKTHEGKKKDIPCYYRHGNHFSAGIPDTLKKEGYPLFGLESFTDPAKALVICEGQKAQHALASLGFQCVTSILGAHAAQCSDWQPIQKAQTIYLLPDNDVAGETYIQAVQNILNTSSCPAEVYITRLPDLPTKGDICDWLQQQPELRDWDQLESISAHPARDALYQRLQNILSEHSQETQSGTNWPNPEPIENNLLPVEPLRSILIPEPYREWLTDIAERMQCPLDFVAIAAIVATASVIGTGCGIKPKKLDDWLVIPNLWGGIIGRPGMLKTPATSEIMQILNQFESESKKVFDHDLIKYKAEMELFKAEKEALKSTLLHSKKQLLKNKLSEMTHDPMALKEQFIHLQEPEKPIYQRFKTNDATIEKLSELLADNPRGLMIYRDELMGLLATWNREGHDSDRAFFLEAWNGDGSLTTDRIGRGTVHTENLCLSILGNTQPAKLSQYIHNAIGGKDNDGLLQRFQLLIYPDVHQGWQMIDRVPNHTAKQKAVQILKTLTEIDFTKYGAIKEASDRFAYYRFDEKAQVLFYEWLSDLENQKLKADEQPIVLEHLSKYRSLMPTLALIFHLIDVVDGKICSPITEGAAICAIGWCEYLESHARRIYGLGIDMTQQAAAKLAQKIQQGELSSGFTVRDIYRKHWGLLNDKDPIHKACEELVDAGWLQEMTIKQLTGRPRHSTYLINPKIKVKIKTTGEKNFP